MLHLPQQVLDRLGRHAAVAVLAGDLPGARVQLHELGVVVEHLLEVGNVPRAVGGVPGESPAHVVVDPALRHPVERDRHHLQRVGHAAQRLPQAELQRHRLRELRCAAEPAPAAVERGPQGLHGLPGDLLGQADRSIASSDPTLAIDSVDLAALRHDLVAPLVPRLGDPRQHLAERRHPVTRLRRVVRARVERPPVGREERRHRPAAVAGHRLHGVHVDAVEVGSLLPVHLDRDEALRSSTPRSPRPRTTRAPSRGTSGRPRSRSTGRSARRVRVPRPAPPVPTGTSPPGCARAAGGRGWSRRASRFAGRSLMPPVSRVLPEMHSAASGHPPPMPMGCGDERGHPGLGGGREPGARAGADPCAARRGPIHVLGRCPTPPRPLAALEEGLADLVLVDLDREDGRGAEVVGAIRDGSGRIRVLAASTAGRTRDRGRRRWRPEPVACCPRCVTAP